MSALAHSVATYLEEELDEVDVVRLLAEVLLQEVVDSGLEHERVVDGNVADVGLELAQYSSRLQGLPGGTSMAGHGG